MTTHLRKLRFTWTQMGAASCILVLCAAVLALCCCGCESPPERSWFEQDFAYPKGADLASKDWRYELKVYRGETAPDNPTSLKRVTVTVQDQSGRELLKDRLELNCAQLEWQVVWERVNVIEIDFVEVGSGERRGNAYDRRLMEEGPFTLARRTYEYDKPSRMFVERAPEVVDGVVLTKTDTIPWRRYTFPEPWPLSKGKTAPAVWQRLQRREPFAILVLDSRVRSCDQARKKDLEEEIVNYGVKLDVEAFDLADCPSFSSDEASAPTTAETARIEDMVRGLGVTYVPWVVLVDRDGNISWRSADEYFSLRREVTSLVR